MKRNVVGALSLLAGVMAACSESPTATSRLRGSEAMPVVSDPPPPPADGDDISWEGCGGGGGVGGAASGCPAGGGAPVGGPFIQIPFLSAEYFKAPGTEVAFVTFGTSNPGTLISRNARVRDHGTGVIGSGTIEATVVLPPPFPPFFLRRITVDLSTAQGSLAPDLGEIRHFFFTAIATDAFTGVPFSTRVLFWYSF